MGKSKILKPIIGEKPEIIGEGATPPPMITPPSMHWKLPLADYNALCKLRKITSPSQQEIEEIFNFYKKYVNPKQKTYQVSCNCSNSIVELYWGLIKWFDENNWQFEGYE